MSKKNYTHIVAVLDKSGSMDNLRHDTIGGFNSFVKDQKEEDGEGTLTLVQFNCDYEVQQEMVSLGKFENLTMKTYNPTGGTALRDAIGKTINKTERSIADMPEEERPEKVVFLIQTDGDENSSKEFSQAAISEMVKRKEDDDDWDFVFMGANIDAFSTGGGLGVRSANTQQYDVRDTSVMYASVSDNMKSYRKVEKQKGEKIGFFSPEESK